MLSCSIWFSGPSFLMGGAIENRCLGRVYGADGAVRLCTVRMVSCDCVRCGWCRATRTASSAG